MKSLKFFAAAACAALLMTSCSEEQSVFNVQNVPGRSILKGHVEYNTGTTLENGHFVYNYVPAANLDLKVIVDNSNYGDYAGETVFTTTTDENGNYSIELPAPLENHSDITIQSSQFEGTYSTVQAINNQIQTVEETVVFGVYDSSDIYFLADGICIKNLECNVYTHEAIAEGFVLHSTLNGTIGRNSEFYVAPERKYNEDEKFIGWTNARVYNCFVPAPNADLLITVTSSGRTFNYNATTDANGNYTLNVPVKSFPANYSYEVTIMPQNNSTFTNYVAKTVEYNDPTFEPGESWDGTPLEPNKLSYTDYEAEKLDGWFAQNDEVSGYCNAQVAAKVNSMEAKALIFNTNNTETDYNPNRFSSELSWKSEIEEMLKEEKEQ